MRLATGVDRLADRVLHRAQIVLARRFLEAALAHRVHAQRRVADIHAVIEPLGQAFDICQVFGEGLPGPVDPGHHRLGRDVLDRGQAAGKPFAVFRLARRQRKPAIAHHHAGDAVPARAAAQRVPGNLRVHMGVTVDKAGTDDHALGVDHPLGRCADATDFDDPAGADTDIGAIARQPRAVDHGAVLDQQIERHRRLSSNSAARIGASLRGVNRCRRTAATPRFA
jgi:hypothetical protein